MAPPPLTSLPSALHVRQPNRGESKILAGPKDNPKLHSLNGQVKTPILNHLGSSSWHSYDGLFIMLLGKHIKLIVVCVTLAVVFGGLLIAAVYRRSLFGWKLLPSNPTDADMEKRARE